MAGQLRRSIRICGHRGSDGRYPKASHSNLVTPKLDDQLSKVASPHVASKWAMLSFPGSADTSLRTKEGAPMNGPAVDVHAGIHLDASRRGRQQGPQRTGQIGRPPGGNARRVLRSLSRLPAPDGTPRHVDAPRAFRDRVPGRSAPPP